MKRLTSSDKKSFSAKARREIVNPLQPIPKLSTWDLHSNNYAANLKGIAMIIWQQSWKIEPKLPQEAVGSLMLLNYVTKKIGSGSG